MASAPAIQQDDASSVIRVILRGAHSIAIAGAPTEAAMASFVWRMSDTEIAAVSTYVRNAWGKSTPAVAAGTIRDARKALADRTAR